MSLELLREKFGYSTSTNKKESNNGEKINKKLNVKFNNDIQNLKYLKSPDQLDLLKERFSHSAYTNKKETDNGEKINEKLNDKFNSNGIENLKSQYQGEVEEKEKIIENLETESSNLSNP